MALSWNEIKSRAITFSKEWENEVNEDAEAKSFLDGFFNVFGISRRRFASFEVRVTKGERQNGYIDLLWKGVILIEMKSRGKDLDRAYKQALDYFPGLTEKDLPKYVLVCDFDRFRLFDLDENEEVNFQLKDLYKFIKEFGFIAGYHTKKSYKEEDAVNIQAAEMMGKLHDKLEAVGYKGHQLEVYLVRLLFCLFADDTTIFEKNSFQEFIDVNTKEDGSDLAARLSELFYILNTPPEKRLSNIDETLNSFPYVNGKLFEENLAPASFDSKMRKILLDCCTLDWGLISPAIFGSMFQSVMNPQERRNLGAHYTSEKNILKLIKPLFLDDLKKEFSKIKSDRKLLVQFHKKLSTLKFLDPACGCGNFLVITYRELRLLEIQVLRELYKSGERLIVENAIWIDVDQFYGIEYEEFPAQIATVALWLIDHQMNLLVSEEFGEYFVRLPLRKSATVVHGDALETAWQSLIIQQKESKELVQYSYIFGNPPFIGSKLMKQFQRDQIKDLFGDSDGSGVLDYVSGWFIKAAKYIQGTKIKVAFVSTNSISQGEQVGALWDKLLSDFNIKIHFAHRTFKWQNEARGIASVYCNIIGFGAFDLASKLIYEYESVVSEPHEIKVNNISPYLVAGGDTTIRKRSKPLCGVPEMFKGSQPTDGGNLLFTDVEKTEFLKVEPKAKQYIKPFISAHEYINGENRWCLWLVDAKPEEVGKMPKLLERLAAVKRMRLESTKAPTRQWANYPGLFTENRQPISKYVLVPSHSSENRKYIPMGFMTKNDILNNSCFSVPNASLYHFGVLTSLMHMAWVKTICGRIKSDYRYSNTIVYTNFPWPESPTQKQRDTVEKAAQYVLDARLEYPNSSLADLYDPLTMPASLMKAHQQLDKAVDSCYRSQPFVSDLNRMEFLFSLYDKYSSGLFPAEKKTKKSKK